LRDRHAYRNRGKGIARPEQPQEPKQSSRTQGRARLDVGASRTITAPACRTSHVRFFVNAEAARRPNRDLDGARWRQVKHYVMAMLRLVALRSSRPDAWGRLPFWQSARPLAALVTVPLGAIAPLWSSEKAQLRD
jgi:hypothetical protein